MARMLQKRCASSVYVENYYLLYTVKLRPSDAMRLRTRAGSRFSTAMQLSSLSSTNETSLFVHFLIMCDFFVLCYLS